MRMRNRELRITKLEKAIFKTKEEPTTLLSDTDEFTDKELERLIGQIMAQLVKWDYDARMIRRDGFGFSVLNSICKIKNALIELQTLRINE